VILPIAVVVTTVQTRRLARGELGTPVSVRA
jgi:hypothetical protein